MIPIIDSTWTLIEAEACISQIGSCEAEVFERFNASVEAGAFKKDVYRQCSRGEEVVFQQRLDRIVEVAGEQ